jgi:small neutral amino acid transporter SnatA (MarC family)
MNKKVITVIVVIVVVALCALAMIYAPNIMETLLRMHRIPQH